MTLDHSLFRLSHLRVLDLHDNGFNGTIPKRLAELTRLTYLDLSFCSFSGEVPTEISQLTRLVYLDLSEGGYSLRLENSSFTTLVRGLRRMQQLKLGRVAISMSGKTLSAILSSSMPNLQSLNLWDCNIYGTLDGSILQLRYLSYIDLSWNNLSYIPEFFQNFTSLRVLKLSDCGLRSFPSGIFLLPKLETLDASDNGDLIASFPSENIPSSSNIQYVDLRGALKVNGDLLVLSNLTKLMHLDLIGCTINGSIPSSWALESISELYLSSNNLSGSIPEGICSSSNLTRLDLSYNSLSGMIPSCLFNLSHLEQINLRVNLLSSGISSSHFNLPSVKGIGLSDNLLKGSIHSSIFNLPSLRYLSLDDNLLSGEIAASIVNLDSLSELTLSDNMLTGSIPSFLFNLSNLDTLDLSNNKFSGSIPSISGNTNLFLGKPGFEILDLSSNCLSGAILLPFNFESLQSLDFSNNKALTALEASNSSHSFDGTSFTITYHVNLSGCALNGFPKFLGNLQNQISLGVLDLSDNDISGNIPSWFWWSFAAYHLENNEIEGFEAVNQSSFRAGHVSFLSAHNNHIAGEIPSFICNNFTALKVLDLSNNDLTGTLPNCLGGLEYLAVLSLANNRLRGQIPAFRSSFAEVINFNNNLLSGKIDPRALHNCTGLQVLDMGDNRLNDTFPSWLSSFDNLTVLILRSNHLHGPITLSGSRQVEFPSLQIFDISENHFSGSLPVELFKNLKAMMAANESTGEHHTDFLGVYRYEGFTASVNYLPAVVQTIKRMSLLLRKIRRTLVIIDLSNNMFTNKIPEEIGMLKGLHILNISYNNLSGTIPRSLGNLKQLEALDLSYNHLSGVIPVELASQLTFLEVLNLSYNELHGKIPQGNQFDSFDETCFEGNPELCGSQVNRPCSISGRDGVHREAVVDKEGDKQWGYGALGFGFATGILMMVVPTVFSGRFGSWYWNAIDRAAVFLVQICHLPKAPKRSQRARRAR